MGIKLRQGPSGKLLTGTAVAAGSMVIPVWNNTTQEWDSTTVLIPTASTPTPLSNVFFVDKGTAVAPGDQNGSISAPFATITAAIAAISALATPRGTILVNAITNDGDYSAEGPLALTPTDIVIAPIAGYFFSGTYDAAAQGPILVDSITVPGGAFHVVTLFGVSCIGVGTITFAEDGFLYMGAACQSGAIVCTAPTAGLFVAASDGTIGNISGCADLSTFNNMGIGSAGKVITCLGTTLNFMNCRFPNAAIEIEFLGAAGTANMDAVTNFFWKAATETLTNGVKVIIGDLTP